MYFSPNTSFVITKDGFRGINFVVFPACPAWGGLAPSARKKPWGRDLQVFLVGSLQQAELKVKVKGEASTLSALQVKSLYKICYIAAVQKFYCLFLSLENWNRMQDCFSSMLNTEGIWFFDSLIELLCYHPHMLWGSYVVKSTTILLDSIFLWLSLDSQEFIHGQHPGLGLSNGFGECCMGSWLSTYENVYRKKAALEHRAFYHKSLDLLPIDTSISFTFCIL